MWKKPNIQEPESFNEVNQVKTSGFITSGCFAVGVQCNGLGIPWCTSVGTSCLVGGNL